ncbi:cyclic nucleotide-binding domain-containing protein [Coxiella burnetii]|uniref:cyclic nucleotide-binding domain-containing protein n=1 Tax=Coxiella burnetii TaxID=777 RepID=UPI0033140255
MSLFLNKGKIIHFDKGDFIIREKQKPEAIYFVLKGKLAVIRQLREEKHEHQIATLKAGDTIGEMSLLDKQPRSASIQALNDVTVFVLAMDDFNSLINAKPDLYKKIMSQLSATLSRRLRYTNDVVVASLQSKITQSKEITLFISTIIIIMAFYPFILDFASSYLWTATVRIFFLILVFIPFFIPALLFIILSSYRFQTYGLTLNNWSISLYEGIMFSLPILVLIPLIKLVLLYYEGKISQPVFFSSLAFDGDSVGISILIIVAYITFSILQEIMARGVLQTSLQRFFVGKYSIVFSIIMSNLIYASTHVMVSPISAALVFPLGLFFGWLYARHQSLVGVCTAHVLIGTFAFYLVGFRNVF